MSDFEQPVLFDPGPAVVRDVQLDPPMSATRRLTERNRDLLRDGVHPATHRKLLVIEEGAKQWTCGGCKYARKINPGGDRSFWKCERHRLGMSHSAASDIRVSWPACALFEPLVSTGEPA